MIRIVTNTILTFLTILGMGFTIGGFYYGTFITTEWTADFKSTVIGVTAIFTSLTATITLMDEFANIK